MTSTQDIIDEVARAFDVTPDEIRGPDRSRNLAIPRHAAFALCYQLQGEASMPAIGRRFGYRDHTTVLYGIRRHQSRLESDPEYSRKIAEIEKAVAPIQYIRNAEALMFTTRRKA